MTIAVFCTRLLVKVSVSINRVRVMVRVRITVSVNRKIWLELGWGRKIAPVMYICPKIIQSIVVHVVIHLTVR